MASPFKKKSPLNAYKHSLTSQYVNPRGVIQPIVEADAAKAIGDASKKVLGELSKNYEDKKLANKINGERLEMSNKSRLEKSAAKPAGEVMSKLEYDMNKPSDKSLKNLGRTTIPARTYNSSQGSNKNRPQSFKGGIETGKNIGYIPNKEEVVELERRSVAMMKGSPNKLIEDTMDPYGQPQRGNRDFTFNEKGIAPGTLGNQASMGVQKEIYGGGQAQVAAEQLAAEQLQAPLLSKGHGVKQAHTHPTKTTTKISGKGEMPGSSYVEGDYSDEDASNAVGLSPHTATLVKTTRKGEPYIREKNAPKFPLSKFENFINENIGKAGAPRRSLSNFPRPDYISNEGDQLDPNKFLFQKTPKK